MEMVISKINFDEERIRFGVKCNFYEVRMKIFYNKIDEEKFKRELFKINLNMGFF